MRVGCQSSGVHLGDGGGGPGRWRLRLRDAEGGEPEEGRAEGELYAGSGHCRTGVAGSVDFTVRALARYSETRGEKDEAVKRYAEAMRRAARQTGSIRLDLIGLTLTCGSVMACAYPVDDNADRFMDLLTDELGEDAWFEAGFRRDIWYATILHFAADIEQPAELVDWVDQRRELDLGRTVIDSAELVRFRYENGANGRLMRPEVLATARTGSPG